MPRIAKSTRQADKRHTTSSQNAAKARAKLAEYIQRGRGQSVQAEQGKSDSDDDDDTGRDLVKERQPPQASDASDESEADDSESDEVLYVNEPSLSMEDMLNFMHAYSELKEAEKSGTKPQAKPEVTEPAQAPPEKNPNASVNSDIFAQRRAIVDLLDF